MLSELVELHREVIKSLPMHKKRYLYDAIQWQSQAVCLLGSRGVGKTTMMCQAMLSSYPDVSEGLYISADNFMVASYGLFNIAKEFFKFGGQALYIDEVHKYPNWAQEVKNIIDTYKTKKIVITASSCVELKKSKYDLSRRVVCYELKGLSFREYLCFLGVGDFSPVLLSDLLENHASIASKLKDVTILKYFKTYLAGGYYPFFLEGQDVYFTKLLNVVEKTIYEDISVHYQIKSTTLMALKKIVWLIATSTIFTPNIDAMSKDLKVSREVVYNCLEHLAAAGLISNIYADAQGMKLVRKPGKIILDNTNFNKVINGSLKKQGKEGGDREIFFVNQLKVNHRVNTHDKADFIVDSKFIFEVGGSSKKSKQIKGLKDSYLAIDNIEVGFGHKIPLYIFGFLY